MKVSDRVRVTNSPYGDYMNGETGEIRRTFHEGRVLHVMLDNEEEHMPWLFMADEVEVVDGAA